MEIIPLEHARLRRELDKKHEQNERLLQQGEAQNDTIKTLTEYIELRNVVIELQAKKLSFWRMGFLVLILFDLVRFFWLKV